MAKPVRRGKASTQPKLTELGRRRSPGPVRRRAPGGVDEGHDRGSLRVSLAPARGVAGGTGARHTAVVGVDVEPLVALLRDQNVAVLTGAGISTDSGIPDYRGPQTRHRPRNPIQHRDFLRDPAVRRRYWARATMGWSRLATARPNAAHRALAELQRRGVVSGMITQNVDRLHHAAGSDALELHGTVHEVVCLACGAVEPRGSVHARMLRHNAGYVADVHGVAPDGDVDLDAEAERSFEVVQCTRCGGPLKPNVVFFGGSVPRAVVGAASSIVDAADVLLVVGSSLTVFSGYRFVRRAAEAGQPVAIVNLGPTRGDPHAAIRVDGGAGELLPRVVDALS